MSLLNGKKQTSVAVSVYWDYQNVRVNGNQVGLLMEFLKQQGKPIRLKVYSNFGDAGQKNQVKSLEESGWECCHVPSDLKNSADNQLIADLVKDITENESKLVIIISGDGDFTPIVEVLKLHKKQVMVIGRKGNIKQQLQKAANQFYFIDELLKNVATKTSNPENQIIVEQKSSERKQPQKQSETSKYSIDYHQALSYLEAAIKQAIQLGKATILGFINQLMSHMYPDYQDVSCIQPVGGKKFKKFSDFINAAIQDGIIKRDGDYLQLID